MKITALMEVSKMFLETLYNHAPIWLQNLMCSVKGWQLQKRRFGKEFFRELARLKTRQIISEVELSSFLNNIRNVPAYKEIFNTAANMGRDVRLEDFPIINKAIVNAHYNDYINRSYHGTVVVMSTSGTTGARISIPNSIELINRQWATWWRFREELGIKFGTWCGWLACTHLVVPINVRKPPFWRINYPGRQVMFSPYHLNADNVAIYLKEIERRGLIWLHGFASNVRFLCKLAQEKGLSPVRCVKFVTTGAENLLPDYIEDIKKVFPEAMIRTHYGQTEGVANFSQTIDGDWRVDDDFAYVELIPLSAEENMKTQTTLKRLNKT